MKPLALDFPDVRASSEIDVLKEELTGFREFGTPTAQQILTTAGGVEVPVFINEFWTAKQRAAHSLHEVSYRACFKPQLPRFFIERLTNPGDLVYDPFLGRGTTAIEAALLDRRVAGCDINPLSRVLTAPRLNAVTLEAVATRLASLSLGEGGPVQIELEVFYHPATLRELTALRTYLLARIESGEADATDKWIQMVATNRLTGHSPGFFSVYTLPPNQAVTLDSQRRINAKRGQTPEYRDVKALILRKSRQLLSGFEESGELPPSLNEAQACLITGSCDATPQLASESVDLVVTSPPFLDTINYATDNWLRGWFCGVDTARLPIWHCRRLDQWSEVMAGVFKELYRVLRQGGHIAFEVGEIRSGAVCLESAVVDVARRAGLTVELVLINAQLFTKTSNCWGVSNQTKGTNTNRVVLLKKLNNNLYG